MKDDIYVGRHFRTSEDHYSDERWRRLWDNLGLEKPHGNIQCDECGRDVHVYSASRDEPGYNEQWNSYITYADEVVICGNCIFDAFDCLDVDNKYINEIND